MPSKPARKYKLALMRLLMTLPPFCSVRGKIGMTTLPKERERGPGEAC